MRDAGWKTAQRCCRLLGVVVVSAAASWAQAESCSAPAGQAAARPAWVNASSADSSQYVGVGVASLTGSDMAQALSEAKTKANADLSASIRVAVSSTIRSSESKLSENGKVAVRSSFNVENETVSQLTLQSVRVDGQWVDAQACQLWVRVSLSREEAQRALRLDLSARMVDAFDKQMKLAEQPAATLAERTQALAAAREVLALIEPVLVPTFSAPVARMRIDAASAVLGKARATEERYLQQLSQHVQTYSEFLNATVPAQRTSLAFGAIRALQALQTTAPQGLPGVALPFDAGQRMVQLYDEVQAPCSARAWSEEHALTLPASLKAASQQCTPESLAQEKRRAFLAGRSVYLSCSITLDGKARPWDKACSAMQEKLARDGVVVMLVAPAAAAKDAVQTLRLSATGSIKARIDPETQSEFYRFEGTVANSLKGQDMNVSDSYEGITGWNPVSRNMTGDVLALNVVARFDAALTRNWMH